MSAIDLTYLKKRAELIGDSPDGFQDAKVLAALAKIVPPHIVMGGEVPENNGYECEVPNKSFRNWIDLIPENERGFIRFIYVEGNEADVGKYITLAMTAQARMSFHSFVSKDASDSDLFLMRYLLWRCAVLRRPVGCDFGNYEMNAIFNGLPVDISKDRIKVEAPPFADFYRMIKFAEWGIRNAG